MTELEFGKLADISLRVAWKDEASNFTPWLAENLNHLGDSIGIPLEVVTVEATLPTKDDWFSADILARNVYDDSNVLIENQLERSDHTHLGQILTYLAGLQARTVIWTAQDFREAHLAAIKWLNEHTTEDFAFFAVKVRVVQIGNSALAPLFEVMEQPNTWERRQQNAARTAKALTGLGEKRRAFWIRFFAAYPANAGDGAPGGHSNMWRKTNGGEVIVSYYIAKDRVGVFIRGSSGVSADETADHLEPIVSQLADRLSAPFGPSDYGYFCASSLSCDYSDTDQFEKVAAWLNERVTLYSATIDELLGDTI